MISTDVGEWKDLKPEERELLQGRTMRCKKAEPLPVEWVVRGYLTGSGWKDYQATGYVSGVEIPKGLQHAQALPQPILTASTKAEEGHDEPISFEQVQELVGEKIATQGRQLALALYQRGHDYAKEKGYVLADTKFELGLLNGRLILIDECLTPDSSRYWPKDQVKPGSFPESYDKQVVRDYLETLDWNKKAPGPVLPQEIQEKALERYLEIHKALTGRRLF
jgi:phosphoribosylaminoimidazole-succinocarboxamide synthase